MRCIFNTFLLPALILLISFSAAAQVLDGDDQIPGQYLIQFDNRINLQKFQDKLISTRSNYIAKSLGNNSFYSTIYSSDLTYDELKEFVSNLDGVVAFQKDYYLEERSKVPNDPLFNSDQWDMKIIKAPEAWDFTTGGKTPLGHDIVVAILDGGFYTDHPDLIDNLFTNFAEIPGNGIDDDNNGYVDDVHGVNLETGNGTHATATHGTGVMGIIGAKGNNNQGIAGVNWNVKIMPVSKAIASVSKLIESYAYIKEFRKLFNKTNGQQGAFIVATNLSAGLSKKFPVDQPIWCNMYDTLGNVGILSTGATANANDDVDVVGDLPSTCESNFLMVVTNTTENDVKYGNAGYGSKSVDLGAPGEGCTSTADPIGYTGFGGTSCATPHVTGAIALLYSAPNTGLEKTYMAHPAESALNVKKAILDNVDIKSDLIGKTVTGGRLNLFRMINNFVSATVPPLEFSFQVFPNPAENFIEIDLGDKLNEEALVMVIDMTGRIVSKGNFSIQSGKITQPLAGMQPGIYCIKIISGKYSGVAKFVKL